MASVAAEDLAAIDEASFWRSLTADTGDAQDTTLRRAIDAGLAGRRDEAYRLLGAYHATTRGHSWERAREWAKDGALTKAKLHATLAAVERDAADRTKWPANMDRTGAVGRIDLLIRHTIATGDTKSREMIAGFLAAAWEDRERLFLQRYPFCGQLGGYSQFHLFWWGYLALVHTGDDPGVGPGVPTDAAAGAMRLILALGRSLRRQAERYIVHNIFTAGSYALLFLSRTMREFSEANEWDRRAVRWLDLDFDRSFFADGGHAERNWGYGSHTIGRLTHAWQFARETGGMHGHEAHYLEGLRRAYRFYAYTLGPDDLAPGFGDEGLGVLTRVIDAAMASGVFDEGTPRTLGVDRKASYNMQTSGVAIMRGGAPRGDTRDVFANITYGDFAGWHSHHDLLSMNLWAHGETLLEEVPRFGQYEHPMDHLWRCPEAHNQLLVDGYWYDSRPVMGEGVLWHSDEKVDVFSALHRAYRAVPQNEHRPHVASGDLVVSRTIVFVKDPGYALVVDSVRHEDGRAFNRATSQWWHSPFGFRVLGKGVARTKGRKACLIAQAYPDTLRRMEIGTDFTEDEIPTFYPPLHPQWHHLRTRSWGETGETTGLGFATLLLPFVGGVPRASVHPLAVKGGVRFRADAFEVTTANGHDVVTLNPEGIEGATLSGKPLKAKVSIKLGGRAARRWHTEVRA